MGKEHVSKRNFSLTHTHTHTHTHSHTHTHTHIESDYTISFQIVPLDYHYLVSLKKYFVNDKPSNVQITKSNEICPKWIL
jgi:hypothetical protein